MARISIPREAQRPQDYASDGTDGVGFIQFWGNSPALDLLGDPQAAAFGPAAVGASPVIRESNLSANDASAEDPEADGEGAGDATSLGEEPFPASLPGGEDWINVLVTGGADVRHVLKTVARRRSRGRGGRLRFFLHERHHEVLARHLLFMQVFNNRSIPVRERMEVFLSLYGNTLVRERDSSYVEDIAKELVEIMTDNSSHPLTEILDLSHLKFKDRDILQDIFKSWSPEVPFDVEALRDQRCRGYYRDRYDYRKNLMDFDYQTHLKPKAGIINWFHFKEFRYTGVAFETRLASYNTPNRTLSSYTEAKDNGKGTTVEVRGFWGDILNSPYFAFGINTDPDAKFRLFKISGSQYRHTETDIAEYNVTSYLSEMETGEAYSLPPERPEEHVFPYASPLEEMRAVDQVEEVEEEQEKRPPEKTPQQRRGRRAPRKVDWPPLSTGFDGVEVVLLAGELRENLKKPKYRGLFHRAFVGSMGVMPLFEEVQINGSGGEPFRKEDGARILRPPSKEAPEAFGLKREACSLAQAMAPGAEVVCETMKYQAHFDAQARVSFRHRMAQVGHLAGWRLQDERRAVPRIEDDMKEASAQSLEKDATDFLRFVVMPPEGELPEEEPLAD